MTIHSHSIFAIAATICAFPYPMLASETDSRIESSFHKSYVYQTYLHEDKIVIHSENGVVSLKGEVAKDSHKDLAEETVSELPGVKKVENNLSVKGKQPEKNSDLWIHTKVETALLFHRNVSAKNTEVTVRDGVVLLKGKSENQAQKELTSEYVLDVTGVKSVKNEMTVVTPASPSVAQRTAETVDDASITALVKVSLLSHRSTSALNTHVKTKDGVVTLTGKAMNAAEKTLVTKLASDIEGVKSVVNNMSLEIAAAKG
jgi:hyperosmotically inducible periplasmic protein